MKIKNLKGKEYFLILLALVVIIVLFNITIYKIYWVPSNSMENIIKENDFTYVYQLPYILNYGDPDYEEVLVFKYPVKKEYDYVKRLIGKPGDLIHIKNNKVFRNDIEIIESYLPPSIIMEDFGPVLVPKDSYFFMGDNRNRSSDSREWGFVDYSLIKGKVISIIWPLERAGVIK